MRVASVYYRDYAENILFTPGAGENNGEFYLPYAKLRERFLTAGIELNTPDVNAGRDVAFELHINCRRQDPSARAYVYLYENPLIRPLNRDRAALARYAKWFAWDGALRDDPRTVSLLYPNRFDTEGWNGPEKRPLFCVLVASNKALTVVDPRDQYQARVRILDWYERHAPADFHLFGRGWDRPAALPGRWGRVRNQLRKILSRFLPAKSPYATWRGPVDDKIELLTRARFCLAHENCRDLEGYVTEKLFVACRSTWARRRSPSSCRLAVSSTAGLTRRRRRSTPSCARLMTPPTAATRSASAPSCFRSRPSLSRRITLPMCSPARSSRTSDAERAQARGPYLRCGAWVGAIGSIWTPAQAGWRPKAP